MSNIKINNFPPLLKNVFSLLAELRGKKDNPISLFTENYKTKNFIYNLNENITSKNYKGIIDMLADEYMFKMYFDKDNGEISLDEKRVRQVLATMGYEEKDFFRPMFENNAVVSYINEDGITKLCEITSVRKEGEAYFYNLIDAVNKTPVANDVNEDNVSDINTDQSIEYFKKTDTLPMAIFEHFVPYEKRSYAYKKEVFNALLGDRENMPPKSNFTSILKARENGIISDLDLYNSMVLISDAHNFKHNAILYRNEKENIPTANELANIISLANDNLEIIEDYRLLNNRFKEIREELKNLYKQDKNNQYKYSLYNASDFEISIDYVYTPSLYDFKTVATNVKKESPELSEKVINLCDDMFSFLEKRDLYILNRPDLNNLIKATKIVNSNISGDIVMFTQPNFYHKEKRPDINMENIVNNYSGDVGLLDIDTRQRKEKLFYQFPTNEHAGSILFYSEGKVSLKIPRTKEEFINLLNDYGEELKYNRKKDFVHIIWKHSNSDIPFEKQATIYYKIKDDIDYIINENITSEEATRELNNFEKMFGKGILEEATEFLKEEEVIRTYYKPSNIVEEEMLYLEYNSKIDELLKELSSINSEIQILSKEKYKEAFYPNLDAKELDKKYIEFLELKIKNTNPNNDTNKNFDNSLDDNYSISR